MKKYVINWVFCIVFLSLLGCGKDNYEAPEATLSGRVVYQGQALNVRGTDERVRLQLYQDGYAKRDPIEVFVGQDGSFSAKLFDGQYKLVTRDGNGPWVNSRDTTVVDLRGSTSIDLEVTPFFTISDAAISLASNTMNTSFTINKIVDNAEIDRVLLLLNATAFVDDGFNLMRKEFTTDLTTGPVNLSAEFADNAKVLEAKALFGRVCVWAKGADQGIYSPVIKLK
ncbi:DUF3823 domain-containing protein [Olivibacter domesticus]|uniref:DUF3823 domain-containing protein n=1 Tax=Olivibacter domesticus TaxID=407022 RepID=A0A1H7T5H0_OLID1|nr:DUF3823 domain-containing protein [Olivibacter domesticus]SEL80142.1 Protein of unknown function [Olivibacter domesticus]